MLQLPDGRMVDEKSGEVLDFAGREGMFVYVQARPKWREGWFMAIQEAFIALAKDKALSGRPMRVLTYMMGKLNWENYIAVTQAEIADELGLHKQDVNGAISLLVERGILQRGPKLGRSWSYRLNSAYGWKGKTIHLHERRTQEAGDALAPVDALPGPESLHT